MTPEQKRIAIAEACGWTDCHQQSENGRYYEFDCTGTPPNWSGSRYQRIPDYLNDLNAIAEAVNSLPSTNKLEWLLWMDKLSIDPDDKKDQAWFPLRLVKAGPDIWAKAFLRATGKWEDE